MDSTAATQAGESPFAPPLPGDPRRPLGPRDPGDAWVEGDRGRFWGRFGSAGLLVHDPAKGVLLQHRALWSDQGGTWGLPGGALHQGEEAIHGALREAQEEAAVPPENVRVLFTSVFDVGYWTYTTVVAEARVQLLAADGVNPHPLQFEAFRITDCCVEGLHCFCDDRRVSPVTDVEHGRKQDADVLRRHGRFFPCFPQRAVDGLFPLMQGAAREPPGTALIAP